MLLNAHRSFLESTIANNNVAKFIKLRRVWKERMNL